MPIRLRVPGSGLPFRGAKARAGAGPDACVRARPALLALCLWLCVQMSSGILAFQAVPPPRPAAPAPPQTPQPPQTPLETAVRDALQQYSTALETLDAEQVKKINPSVDSERLKGAFRDMRELKVTIDNIKVLSADGTTARVSCRVMQTFTPKAGTKQNSTVTRVMRLRRQEAAWLIDGFER
jgi:hypothetical protein